MQTLSTKSNIKYKVICEHSKNDSENSRKCDNFIGTVFVCKLVKSKLINDWFN